MIQARMYHNPQARVRTNAVVLPDMFGTHAQVRVFTCSGREVPVTKGFYTDPRKAERRALREVGLKGGGRR